jgi:hypothetical protein
MKLKKILTDVEHAALEDKNIAGLYEKKADGKFHLDVEDSDTTALLNAKEHEKGLREIAERDRDAAKAEAVTLKAEVDRLKADAGKDKNTLRDQLTTEHTEAINKLTSEHAKKVEGLEATVKRIFVSDVALRIASELTDVPDLMLPFIEKRLEVEMVGGEPKTRVLSADGKASAMNPDQLKDEFLHDKRFERIVRGSGANGGGAGGGSGGGGASTKKLKDMGDAERNEWATRDPAGFQKAVDADKNASGAGKLGF